MNTDSSIPNKLHSASPLQSADSRIVSVDIIRGAVMIVMAIDHVRVFSGVPAGGPTYGVFFTRWVTHFCAPAFVFLAGTSAFLYGRRHDNLSRYLLTRGAWLVFLELAFLRLAWTFNFDYAHYEMAGVIWMIGWCMIAMAALSKLPLKVVAAIGLVIIAGHNLLDGYAGNLAENLDNNFGASMWKIFYIGFWAGPISFGTDGPNLIVLYSIFPWIGVMAAGYAFGTILTLDAARRNRLCASIGLGAIALFIILRYFKIYGDPRPWTSAAAAVNGRPGMPPLLSFLNTTKYPGSLLFLLMTLGPTIALIPMLEHARGAVANFFSLFGRVPFFYYVLHIPLIHLLAICASLLLSGHVDAWLFTNHPMGNPPPPDGYMWSLATLYAVWTVAITILYFACRWYADLKSRRMDWWLRYI